MRCSAVPAPPPTLPYLLYTPEYQQVGRRWPLIVFLHGSGERGEDLAQVRKYGLPCYLEAGQTIPAYILAPQCPQGQTWRDLLDRLEATVDDVAQHHPVDSSGLLVTGFSMGGFGAWAWALRNPSRIAALAPVAGSRSLESQSKLSSLGHLPIWIYHGAADRQVPVDDADALASELEASGVEFRYTRDPRADHGATCRLAYTNPSLYEWLLDHAPPSTSAG